MLTIFTRTFHAQLALQEPVLAQLLDLLELPILGELLVTAELRLADLLGTLVLRLTELLEALEQPERVIVAALEEQLQPRAEITNNSRELVTIPHTPTLNPTPTPPLITQAIRTKHNRYQAILTHMQLMEEARALPVLARSMVRQIVRQMARLSRKGIQIQ